MPRSHHGIQSNALNLKAYIDAIELAIFPGRADYGRVPISSWATNYMHAASRREDWQRPLYRAVLAPNSSGLLPDDPLATDLEGVPNASLFHVAFA